MINEEDANLLNRLSDLMNKKYSAECSETASNAHDRLHKLLEEKLMHEKLLTDIGGTIIQKLTEINLYILTTVYPIDKNNN